ncbi:MAG: signal peptidase II, partial [Methylococcales bacterium]|nr:signal peptidase II [Methylococcales bacterium]
MDQLTKLYVHTHFLHGESKAILQGLFNITYVRNYGAAFGILADSPSFFRESFFLFMPPAALLIILYILRSVDARDRIQIFA